jgi:hypothetical protein
LRSENEIVGRLEEIDRRLGRMRVTEQAGIPLGSYEVQLAKDLMKERARLLLRLYDIRHPRTEIAFTDEEADVITVDPEQALVEQIGTYESTLAKGSYPAGLLIFPFRPTRGIWRIDVASISARREGESIRVSQPLNAVRNTKMFEAEVNTLPLETFLGGILLPRTQIVGVKLYDEDGKVVLVRAEDLLKFAEASQQAVLLNIGLTAADVWQSRRLGVAEGAPTGPGGGRDWNGRGRTDGAWRDRVSNRRDVRRTEGSGRGGRWGRHPSCHQPGCPGGGA